MCLNNIKYKQVSDGTALVYKVFFYDNEVEAGKIAGQFVSPFVRVTLQPDQLSGKKEYAASRQYTAKHYECNAEANDKINAGFVHGYADKQSALRDFYMFYTRHHYACAIVKCRIPEGETYYDGDFDSDGSVRVRATRAVVVERVEEMFCCCMNGSDHERYKDYHVFARKRQTPRRCLDFLRRVWRNGLWKNGSPSENDCTVMINPPSYYMDKDLGEKFPDMFE